MALAITSPMTPMTTWQPGAARQRTSVWIPAHGAPFDRDLELAVIDGHDVTAIDYPCRRESDGWKSAREREPLGIDPTHWRYW